MELGSPKPAQGFTLIELLVVLALLAAIYGLVSFRLDHSGTMELKGASRQLAAGLRKTRSLAVSRRHDATLTLDVEAREFSIDGDPRRHPLPKEIDISLVTAQTELQGKEAGAIRFFADGTSTGGRVTLRFGSHQQIIDIDWLTGQVRFQQPG